ncbi:MAG: hypothetical protein Q8N60_05005 [Candidatus Diapherotrites archaeon]|nr:hypothetical protein [Candidatus Diapherotrites archaeon]
MGLERKIALYHARMEKKHAARLAKKKAGLGAQATRWALKWERRAARFAAKVPTVTAISEKIEEARKPVKAVEEIIKPVSAELKKEVKREKKKVKKPKKKIRAIKLKRKIKEIVRVVKAELKPKGRKKRGKPKKKKVKPKVEKAVKPVEKEKELVAAILEEPLLKVKPIEEKPKIEKVEKEKKPVETTSLIGDFTEISMPKIKEEEEHDWSAKRFKELEEKLKKLRRF